MMNPAPRKPSLFIIGAPKCGTTAMYEYLRQHPQIFTSDLKEPHFFGDPQYIMPGVSTLERYEKLFAQARPNQVCCEGSTHYLYQKQAAEQIKAYQPDAKIVVMLRNPVDFMYSIHNQELFSLNETVGDFEEALALEVSRSQGENIPTTCKRRNALRYRYQASFSTHVARYIELFGRDHVHIILLDDLASNVSVTYKELLRFIGGVDDTFEPEFRVVNASKRVRFRWLQRIITAPSLRGSIKRVLPEALCSRVGRAVYHWNRRQQSRPPLDESLRKRLTDEMVGEIDKLERLIGLDLSRWR